MEGGGVGVHCFLLLPLQDMSSAKHSVSECLA